MYMDAVRMLADHGLARYEISNFSRPDRASRHNLKYWRREDYLGLGIAAHSCLGNRRFSNTESLVDYLAGNKTATDEIISPHDILCETVMLGMRLDEGVDFSALAQAFGNDAQRYRDKLLTFRNDGFVLQNGDRLSFGNDGMYVSNAILAQTLDFDR